MEVSQSRAKSVVRAWLLLMTAIALHVADEAFTGFLPFYNQSVTDLKLRLGYFPMPTFDHELWLGELIVLI